MTGQETRERGSLIYLTGFMGSGKSTVGPIVANTIGYEFTDIDREIERRAGKQISEIFAEDGEEAFRTFELGALQDLSVLEHHVIALGGGTIASEENFDLVRRSGIMVYIQLSSDEILRRVQRRSDRPLLRAADGSALPPDILQQRILDLLAKREVFYRRADIVVDADDRRVGSTVDEIARRLRRFL